MIVDVVIVGGGPAGLSAALVLGRARKRVLLFDAGSPRNAAAEHIHGFVTQDGTPPSEFRRIGREQLRPYSSVEVRDTGIEAIEREGALFIVQTAAGPVTARRLILAVGMVDELPDLPGYRELWGKSLFQCPYCHAWEVQERPFGYLSPGPQWLEWAPFLKGWSSDVVAFTNGLFAVPDEVRSKLEAAKVRIEERRIVGLRAKDERLAAVMLEGGGEVAREVLFVRPPQRQVALITWLVDKLGLELDEQGFIRVDEMRRTSVAGISAAGDATTMMQGALMAAAAGAQAAYMMNHALTMELVAAGEI